MRFVGTFRHQFAKYQFVAYISFSSTYICLHVYALYYTYIVFLVYIQF